MLWFAFVTGLAGVLACGAVGSLILAGSPQAAEASLYIGLFFSVFPPIFAAVFGHPARKVSSSAAGVEASLDLIPVARTAAVWTVVLFALTMASLVAAASRLPGDSFLLENASLAGRPDRQQLLVAFYSVFHAAAVMCASSGLRWGGPPGALSWPLRLILGSPPGLGAIQSQGKALRYQASDGMSWQGLLLGLVGCLALAHEAVPRSKAANPWLIGALALAPFVYFLATVFGRTTFTIKDDHLCTDVFPLGYRSGRIPLEKISGFEAYPELDSEGDVSSHSVIVLGLSFRPTRIVSGVTTVEQASYLAEQLEALVRDAKQRQGAAPRPLGAGARGA